ncbi:unnamed protein product [Schistosoma mattheei]|uniref:Uncharacterized protein n=1 Tax=Schistosoma mattheei TaxID=31246 RepID=A0AA85B172_9TREM|nr:unnamed protein product [Schistosoma mattheei]
MNKTNSFMAQNHLQTEFELQTPCISNFLDYDLSPSELHNHNHHHHHHQNNNNLLEGGEQCQEINKQSRQQHHPEQQQQQYQSNHTIHHQHQQQQQYNDIHYFNSHLSNYQQNQHLHGNSCMNSTIDTNINDVTMSIMKKIGNDQYFSPELQTPINSISSSHTKPNSNLSKRQTIHDIKELLFDIYHGENDLSSIHKNNDNTISTVSHYSKSSSFLSSILNNNHNRIDLNQSISSNHFNDIHRMNSLLKRYEELPSSIENSVLQHNCQINNCRTNCPYENIHSECSTLQMNVQINNNNNNNNNNVNKIQESKQINSRLSKGKLELKFLLNQDNTNQDISKYGKVAKTIITKTGIQKLFVIRGRVIDTRIQFHYYTLKIIYQQQ